MTETDLEGHVNDTLHKHGLAKHESTDYVKLQGVIVEGHKNNSLLDSLQLSNMYLIRKETQLQHYRPGEV